MAFPNKYDFPPKCLQLLLNLRVPLNILREFRNPKVESAFGGIGIFAVRMPVPKAAVDEDA
jgi:hypothetical protein